MGTEPEHMGNMMIFIDGKWVLARKYGGLYDDIHV
jgi:hypothetical protein